MTANRLASPRSPAKRRGGRGQTGRGWATGAWIDPFRMPAKQEIFAFIRSHFRSVWALETLALLRQNRDRELTRAEMVTGLRGSDLVVVQSVQALAAVGLVTAAADGSARYGPASAALDDLVARTQALYAERPDAVRRMIVEAGNPGIAAFADAFRLRKE
jgi:hypothetical protein